MNTTPTEETPGPVGSDMYDDPADSAVDVTGLRAWLVEHRKWGGSPSTNDPLIREVLDALQAVGDATLIKNGTYRALCKDGAAIERLNAWLQNHGEAAAVLDVDGDAVEAAIGLLSGMRRPWFEQP